MYLTNHPGPATYLYRPVYSRRVRKLNVGFIGCGGIAEAHASRLASFGDVSLVAFSDTVEARARRLAGIYGGRHYTDWRDMLDREKLDVVFICIPPFAHRDEVMAAAEKGVNIYIEKPIALDMRLARDMVRAVEKSGVKSQVGYQQRFSFAGEQVKRMVDGGELGTIGLAEGEYWCRFIRTDWWIDKSKSGGQLVEQTTHLVDLLRWICGDVERVYAEMDRLFYTDVEGMTIEDVSGVVFKFKSGAIGVLSATIGAFPNEWVFRWSIIGWKAMVRSSDPGSYTVYYSTATPLRVEEYREYGRDTMKLAERDLIDAVLNDRETRTPIREGAKTLEVTLAAARSAAEGRAVTLEPW